MKRRSSGAPGGRARVELKPAHVTPMDVVWMAIRRLRTFTCGDLVRATDVERRTVESYVDRLVLAGVVELVEARRTIPRTFALVKDNGVDAPRITRAGAAVTTGDGRERAWAAMKPLAGFTGRELAAIAEAPAPGTVHYCQKLAAAGYLQILDRGDGRRPHRYRLSQAMNTGPKAPRVRKDGTVFDPNTGAAVKLKGRR